MSTSFLSNPAWRRYCLSVPILEELGSNLTGFTALRQPIYSIKSNAWNPSRCPRRPLSAAADAYFTDPLPSWQALHDNFLTRLDLCGPADGLAALPSETRTPAQGGR
ncbi:hypothetical protein, partial [Salinicola sp. MH3R3-1]|uniref:hypothetical protein n=1 Tax=Salinicola sp. MH3R3-1 TaxID=1928762 RepID=UPI001AEFB068